MHPGEAFTGEQSKILQKYVSNTTENVFVLKNLPEVIKGALFSKYARSKLGLRSLLLREFIQNEEFHFEEGGKENLTSQIQKAQKFYDRILDGFGDDSIGELGGAHLAIENLSILATKEIENCRVGGSPLEKSTRYIRFDQKVKEEYLYYKEPILMASAYKELYLETCNFLFDTYSQLIPPLTEMIEKKCPREGATPENAYQASIRAKVLDCLRGLLPAGTLTNVGIFGNGRFFENMIRKLSASSLVEFQELGSSIFNQLSKVIPSFIKRTDNKHQSQIEYLNFIEKTRKNLKILSKEHIKFMEKKDPGVYLVNYDSDSVCKVAASLLYEYNQKSLASLQEYCRTLSNEEIINLFEASCLARENRRHKSPRALENVSFTFEIVSDFGIYRDLQRHRMLTQERQLLTCNFGYYTPKEIIGTNMLKEYDAAMNRAQKAYNIISREFPEEAQYVVPIAYNLNWYFNINLRSLQWLCELRSSPAGHPNYRLVAQKMAKEVCRVIPQFECFFKFVNFDGYDLGRLSQEVRKEEKYANKI